MKRLPLKVVTLSLFLVTVLLVSNSASADTTSPSSNAIKASNQKIAQAERDVVGVASSNDNFSTLVAAVKAADLVGTLQGDGPFTVFAPTDEAFDALPDGLVEFLLQSENKDLLKEILTYHVVAGNVMSTDLETGHVESLNGGLAVNVTDTGVIVNNANVIQADVEASNGTIHAIDTVLLPMGLLDQIQARMN